MRGGGGRERQTDREKVRKRERKGVGGGGGSTSLTSCTARARCSGRPATSMAAGSAWNFTCAPESHSVACTRLWRHRRQGGERRGRPSLEHAHQESAHTSARGAEVSGREGCRCQGEGCVRGRGVGCRESGVQAPGGESAHGRRPSSAHSDAHTHTHTHTHTHKHTHTHTHTRTHTHTHMRTHTRTRTRTRTHAHTRISRQGAQSPGARLWHPPYTPILMCVCVCVCLCVCDPTLKLLGACCIRRRPACQRDEWKQDVRKVDAGKQSSFLIPHIPHTPSSSHEHPRMWMPVIGASSRRNR